MTMSILELSKEIDKLAKIINEKNKELETLQRNYDSKLHMINKYIETISPSSTGTIPEEQLINAISKPIECPHCHEKLWDNQEKSTFLLIPKQKIDTKFDTIATQDEQPQPPTITTSSNKQKKKTNIVCSYCKMTGHTRAKCRKRLNTPM
ncbi:conserved hypothetical protein [Candida dubliniensis CD36]|uniref:Uncharacterized protein n=1 Tax=Candida dubliniensis (strain CD36 / ATCC MYA-646 / CBS 7987 / NCPF 3949 / NRRL Y-17841) TaxID=573826 RepID=B9WLM9_CANDC|nr:conserved hypothetical protein [Candida dubliniensis CD36]CAX39991.1 conserved hypothetical protein [Candida dubliniensis CD36]